MKHLVLIGRVIFGAWMLANGLNHFFLHLYAEPVGHTPLAIQLMTALEDGWMLDVAMVIELVTGALILVGVLAPLALCVVMPISVCAAFWAVILEHQPLGALLALVAVGLNALLCLAYIDDYQGMLQRRAPTLGQA
ncbi:MAG TPA: DoxX family membrane protein [Caulobacteraceae bacterium]